MCSELNKGMKKMNKFLLCMMTLILTCVNTDLAIAADKPDIYQLHQGDKVLVSVWREDTLQREVVVLPDGSITFPLIGRIEVAGLDTTEAGRRITAKLKEYLPDPVVTVTIVATDGNRAYVMG
jgi:polysaccharide export outer membrane protein